MSLRSVQKPDPFGELVGLLRPRAALWGGADGAGRWGLSFPARGDVMLCWLDQGCCELTRAHQAPVRLVAGDMLLIRAAAPFALVSALDVEPIPIETATAAPGGRLEIGSGREAPVALNAARLVFDKDAPSLPTSLLPEALHIAGADPAALRARNLLAACQDEMARADRTSPFIVERLLEVVLADLLRGACAPASGLIAGLRDPVTARALSAMHREVARDWTVAELATASGASRSAFAARFQQSVGVSPIAYLARWRLALGAHELARGEHSVEDIALRIGFRSASAFSTAFRGATGESPRQFAKARSEATDTRAGCRLG